MATNVCTAGVPLVKRRRLEGVGGPGIVNCVGWDHVLRSIQVIEMAMRDLIYKIVPTKIVVK